MSAQRIRACCGGVLLCAWLIAGCGGAATTTVARSPVTTEAGGATASPSQMQSQAMSSSGSAGVTAQRPPRSHHRHVRPPGTLPQTSVLPSADTPAFSAEMVALWRGIRADSVRVAMPAFFPEAAYAQLKGVPDPQGDWQGRLVADYRLDIGAAHLLLAPDAGHARLVEVQVPASDAHWIPPGVCYNTTGYYEVPNARVVYRTAGGATRSLGIASMISWRGVWYVVHLGAVVRATAGGVVDDPSAGPGVSAYSSTC